jgi:hypothetical protein
MKKWFVKQMPRLITLAAISSLVLASIAGRKW